MRIKRILTLIVLAILFCATSALAAEPQLTIEGETTSKPNETKVLTVKISSEKEIGVVSGKIEANEKITSINVTGKNNWNLTYNKETGVFNIYKAQGSKLEEIINISYTTANKEGTGKITLSNLKMTTIEYETKEVSNVEKNITIKNETLEPTPTPGGDEGNDPDPTPTPGGDEGNDPDPAPTPGGDEGNDPDPAPTPQEKKLTGIEVSSDAIKIEYNVGDKFEKKGLIVKAKYSDGTSKEITDYTITNGDKLEKGQISVTISYTENGVTKTTTQAIKVVDDTKTKDKMPNTGAFSVIGITVVIAVFGIVCLVKYNKYREI